jgi:hypothetical protein
MAVAPGTMTRRVGEYLLLHRRPFTARPMLVNRVMWKSGSHHHLLGAYALLIFVVSRCTRL